MHVTCARLHDCSAAEHGACAACRVGYADGHGTHVVVQWLRAVGYTGLTGLHRQPGTLHRGLSMQSRTFAVCCVGCAGRTEPLRWPAASPRRRTSSLLPTASSPLQRASPARDPASRGAQGSLLLLPCYSRVARKKSTGQAAAPCPFIRVFQGSRLLKPPQTVHRSSRCRHSRVTRARWPPTPVDGSCRTISRNRAWTPSPRRSDPAARGCTRTQGPGCRQPAARGASRGAATECGGPPGDDDRGRRCRVSRRCCAGCGREPTHCDSSADHPHCDIHILEV